MKWWLDCKHASQLASREMDEPLQRGERFALRLHQAVCINCARFARQLRGMRELLRSAPETDDARSGLPDPARQRIEQALRERRD